MAIFIGRTYKIRTCDQRIKSPLCAQCAIQFPNENRAHDALRSAVFACFEADSPNLSLVFSYRLDKIAVVEVRRYRDNAPESKHSCVFKPLRRASAAAPRTQQCLDFCVLGRCFVVVRRGWTRSYGSRPVARGAYESRTGCSASAMYDWTAGLAPATTTKHRSPSGRGRHQRMGLHGPHPRNTSSDDQSAADPASAEGPEQGAHVGVTGIACKLRQFAPHGHLVWTRTEAASRWSGRLPQVTLPQL
jgi:hypothetical protein